MSKLVDTLLSLGFTIEDLYNKGILVEANQEEQPEQVQEQEQAEQPEQEQEQEEPQEQAQGQEEQYITKADLDSFKQDLLSVVQAANRSGAVRDSQPEKKMTMAEAIIGLTKEVK